MAHARSEDAERLHDGLEAAVVLEMIGFHVRDDGDLWTQLMEAAVIFVGFDDNEVAFAALGIRRDVAQHPADDDGRIEPRFFQDHGNHRGGRGLAVGAGYADGPFAIDQFAQHFLALDDRYAALLCGLHLDVATFDRRSDDDHVHALKVRGVVSDRDVDAAAGQKIGRRRRFQVAARYHHAPVGEDLSNATHSDSANADEMNVLNVF